jgi:hypothetical protein
MSVFQALSNQQMNPQEKNQNRIADSQTISNPPKLRPDTIKGQYTPPDFPPKRLNPV